MGWQDWFGKKQEDGEETFKCRSCFDELPVSQRSERDPGICVACEEMTWERLCYLNDRDRARCDAERGPKELIEAFKGAEWIEMADGVVHAGSLRTSRSVYGDYTYEQVVAAERTSRRKNGNERPIWRKIP